MNDPSVDGSNPAICGHRKSGHFRRPETGVEFYFTASCVGKVVWTLVRPAAWAALEYVGVMEQAVEQCGDGGGVTEELPGYSGGSGTRNPEEVEQAIPEEVEQRFREVEQRFRRKWNSGSGGRERSSVA